MFIEMIESIKLRESNASISSKLGLTQNSDGFQEDVTGEVLRSRFSRKSISDIEQVLSM